MLPLERAIPGLRVRYWRPGHTSSEYGVITSINPRTEVAFVRYSHQPADAYGQPTNLDDLFEVQQ